MTKVNESSYLTIETKPKAWQTPLIFLALFYTLSLAYWNHRGASFLVQSKEQILNQDSYLALFSSIFVHADSAHLAANSVGFFIYGYLLNAYFGWLVFPVLALLAGLLTQAISLYTYSDSVRLIGASGMVYAMAAMWLVYFYVSSPGMRAKDKLMRIVAYTLVVLLPSSIEQNVSYRAHAIGFLVGAFIGAISVFWLLPGLKARWEEEWIKVLLAEQEARQEEEKEE